MEILRKKLLSSSEFSELWVCPANNLIRMPTGQTGPKTRRLGPKTREKTRSEDTRSRKRKEPPKLDVRCKTINYEITSFERNEDYSESLVISDQLRACATEMCIPNLSRRIWTRPNLASGLFLLIP